MNELGSRYDWEMTVKELRKRHMALSERDAASWEHKLTLAMQRLPYLKSLGKLRSDDDSLVVVLKVVLKEVANNIDAVQKDFRTLLNGHVVGSRKNHAAFVSHSSGFEVYLAILDEEERLFTGAIKVEAS